MVEQNTCTERAGTVATSSAPQSTSVPPSTTAHHALTCGGAVVHPGERREEADELRLDDQRHFQVLCDHVDAQWERCDAPEESARERVGCVCWRCVFGGMMQVRVSARRMEGWDG